MSVRERGRTTSRGMVGAPTKMRSSRILTGVGLAVVFAAIVVVLLANTSAPPSGTERQHEIRLPEVLAGSPVVTSLRGAAALADVSRLHGKAIGAIDAAVARYQDGTTLWISVSSSALEASRLLWRMNRGMANGTDVFTAPRPQELGGRPVFITEGIGQIHYYYQSGVRVIWLGVPAGPHAGAAIEALLDFYP